MSRRKTRVTRMSRRKARSGTRKRRGGWGLPSWFPNPFAKKPEDPNALAAPPGAHPDDVPAAPAAQAGGARKTRHRRRRHRK